jgi:hypothetical protein
MSLSVSLVRGGRSSGLSERSTSSGCSSEGGRAPREVGARVDRERSGDRDSIDDTETLNLGFGSARFVKWIPRVLLAEWQQSSITVFGDRKRQLIATMYTDDKTHNIISFFRS